ncbi:MAG: metallophosphoesterase [Elusimicrobia bacterium]|jgi:Icc-related predicted phosphoesterase|nr:metallophosphoesterase [Elusimicrobiota bacterium]
MKIFITSDIHGNKALLHQALKIIKAEHADALIIAGDIAAKGFYQLFKKSSGYEIRSAFSVNGRELIKRAKSDIRKKLDFTGFIEQDGTYLSLLEIQSKQKKNLREICKLLQPAGIPVFMLIGNDDHIPDSDWDKTLEEFGIVNLNLKTHNFGTWKITGFQYVPPTPWNTNNELPEIELAVKLKDIEKQVNSRTVFVTHCPPRDILDRLYNGLPAGSESIRKLVENKQPAFHIFGHIHESSSNKKIGNTLFCNVACSWINNILRGCVIDLDKRTVKPVVYNGTNSRWRIKK